MASLSPGIISMILGSVSLQVLGVSLLPLTRGLTAPLPTIGCASAFLLGIALMARIAHNGVNLSTFIPIFAALMPLGGIAVGITIYGEPASLPKVAALVGACGLIGLANVL